MKKVRVLLLLLSVLLLFSCKSAPKQEEKPAEPEKVQEQEMVKEETDKKAEQKDMQDDFYVIYFAPQSYQIDQFTAQRLKEISEDLKAKNVKKIVISGHSAKLDSQKDEDRIALQRAIAVAGYFQKMKLFDANSIIVEGKGAAEPARTHSEITERFKNRRVEIHSVE
ncbi:MULTISPECIES: OmpA family protein [unclassified Treponema]|uniref:OmpA family protein n=1 Tax=unclassified Treponema TaxID=2638727 RepID=UPI0020A42CD3|nr:MULTISPECIES: OmpA family protein [unclassified Treponema]UTC67996.1 OmpA family protein [Treponema sp. OMZ 789]UTC70718.1 OmpA family protein [Treponema sp. OMZ 790]UTC73438.1 OmpA family protein [Treponema sp. OMZ 791]